MLKIKSIISLLFIILLTSCSSGAPEGTDSDVKALVIEITMDEIRKQIAPAMYQKITNVPVGIIGIKITYEGLLNKRNKGKNSEVIKAIDKAMSEMSVSLENIRIDSINDKTEKSESSADIVINGKTSPITYTAQKNSEGDLYVEVFGL